MGGIASNKIPAKANAQEEEKTDAEVDDLEARMAALGGMWVQLITLKDFLKKDKYFVYFIML